MTADKFVKLFYNEKENILNFYFEDFNSTEIGTAISDLQLNKKQLAILKHVIDLILTDSMYTTLLGLDGEVSIGGVQEDYRLSDSQGNLLTNCGEIEKYAYEYFQEKALSLKIV